MDMAGAYETIFQIMRIAPEEQFEAVGQRGEVGGRKNQESARLEDAPDFAEEKIGVVEVLDNFESNDQIGSSGLDLEWFPEVVSLGDIKASPGAPESFAY